MTETKNHRRPALVATTVLVAGILASLAGNVQAINLDNAAPGIGAHLSAVFWPAMLFGMVELLLHTPWMANWRDRLTKGAAVLLVAGVAAWVSYWHLANVLSHYGYDVASRYAGPLAIDAAMVLATLALNRVGHARRLATVQAAPVTTAAVVQPMSRVVEDLDTRAAEDSERGLFERLERDLATTYSNLPVPVFSSSIPVSPAPAGVMVRPKRLSEDDSADAQTYATIGKAEGLPAGYISELLGGYYGVSARTIRRQPWWTPTMAGGLASDVA